jgi:hypothetical protein
MQKKTIRLVVLGALVAVGAVVRLEQQHITDWWRLRNYTPPVAVASLMTADTMTDEGRTLFYVNRPVVTAGKTFVSHCPAGTEKTIVLGCYMGRDNGIYIYQVADERLDGVEQVTAAHEMLHAAYRRLSGNERTRINTLLSDFYEHDLQDQRVKDTIEAYKKSEPNDLVNEMHSVFGTEVASLPAELETYYRQYFVDRSKVVGFAAAYQAEFTSRETQVAQYDAQLAQLKPQITAGQAELERQSASLEKQGQQLDQYRSSGQVDAYNRAVPGYNNSVDAYNALRATTKNLINQYNDIVDKRNAIALEEQELTQELSASALP